MSVIKTALFLLVLVSMAMGGIYMKNSATVFAEVQSFANIAPVIVGNDGSVRFPERFPNPEAVYQIRAAVQQEDVEALNDLLIKHHFYLLPERMHKVN